MKNESPIDVVITWVDGNELAHIKKMQPYLEKGHVIREDVAAPTRFRSKGEIFFCVASILRFAPFVRKIFIVTDHQNPELGNFIQENFPENKTAIVLVDHTVLFKGYESCLPTFNSLSIETCLFRIPDLSERFVYFNDDLFLVRSVRPEDWFIDYKIVAYGTYRSLIIDRFISVLKPLKDGFKPFGFKDSMINAAKKLSIKTFYFYMGHTPHPMKKSVLEEYYKQFPENFAANISHRFRDSSQFNPQALSYMLALQGGYGIRKTDNKLLFIKPVHRRKTYIDDKIRTFKKNEQLVFCCVESLDLASEQDVKRFSYWMSDLLNITNFPV